jgi:hypothetical protein
VGTRSRRYEQRGVLILGVTFILLCRSSLTFIHTHTKIQNRTGVTFNRPLSLQYTDFTGDCLNELETNDSSSSDSLLALMTRLQRIAEIAEFKMRSKTETLETLKVTIDELKLQLDQLQPQIQACSHRILYHIIFHPKS